MMRLALAVSLCLMAMTAAPALAKHGLTTGFADPAFANSTPQHREQLLDEGRVLGARIVRLSLGWAAVAPRARPRGFDPTNPADPAYHWELVDAMVRDAAARGYSVLLDIERAPRWAEGPQRPRSAPPGTWRPRARALGAFATAAARRYSGAFQDPLDPSASLPHVRHWQAWNEPNISAHLNPQWERQGRRLVPASPTRYRAMLNAVYAAVKRVDSDNFVVTAGTAPYGDPERGGNRLRPALFLRRLLCLRGRRLIRTHCPTRARLDAISHHPYAVRGPGDPALNRDDVAIADVHKLARILHAASGRHTVLPAGRKRLWITELSWDSRPPDPRGVPEAIHARWLADAFYSLWRQGVDTITWFQVRDQLPDPSYAATNQSGVLFADGSPKLAARAFQLPFAARRLGRRVAVWALPAATGRLTVERRRNGSWTSVRTLHATSGQLIQTRLRETGPALLRLRIGRTVSITRRVSASR